MSGRGAAIVGVAIVLASCAKKTPAKPVSDAVPIANAAPKAVAACGEVKDPRASPTYACEGGPCPGTKKARRGKAPQCFPTLTELPVCSADNVAAPLLGDILGAGEPGKARFAVARGVLAPPRDWAQCAARLPQCRDWVGELRLESFADTTGCASVSVELGCARTPDGTTCCASDAFGDEIVVRGSLTTFQGAPGRFEASTICRVHPRPERASSRMVRHAWALGDQIRSGIAREFLMTTPSLPRIGPYTVHLPDRDVAVDEELFYTTKYGEPLAYARALEVVGLANVGIPTAKDVRYLDFGFGSIGQLMMLENAGADVTGVDVDPLLGAMYAKAQDDHLRIRIGRWPFDASLVKEVGARFDLFVSKNVLKRGYIHPDRPADPKKLIDLGVTDDAFVRALADTLVAGGVALIYNITPHPSRADEPFVPWSDGRCPFSRETFEKAGFRVVEFDRDDTASVREMAKILEWDKGEDAMDLDHDLFATYSLFQKSR